MMDDTERRKLIESLALIEGARATKNAAGRTDTKLSGPVKQHLEMNPDDELIDGESGISAWLEPRKTTSWDLRSLAQRKPDLLVWLAHNGLLTVNTTAFTAIRTAGDAAELGDTEDFKIVGESTSLRIGKREES